MSKTYKDYNITESAIEKAEKVLSDNGVEADEVKSVLQALGYVLLDCEMYPAPIYPSETVARMFAKGNVQEAYELANTQID